MSDLPTIPETLGQGRFVLHERLGTGGMAWVFRATDLHFDVVRAIKLIRLDAATRASWRRRFTVEAKAMAQIRHPHVVQVFDSGRDNDIDYIVMEYVTGGSLADRIDRGPCSPVDAIRWIRQVLGGLGAVHRAGIVHRDVKPANILLDEDDEARLTDFGIAMVSDAAMRRTRAGVAMGSMSFMPPEQRQDAATVTPRADLYATGATLYRALTARSSVDLFLAGATSTRWNDLPPALVPVLRKACAEHPEDRFDSADHFAEALTRVERAGFAGFVPLALTAGAGRSPPTESALPDREGPRRTARYAFGILASTLLLVGGLLATVATPGWWRASVPVAPATTVAVEVVEPPVSAVELAPSVQPTPDPNPVPVARPAPVPAPVVSPAHGTWRMSRNGVRFALELDGPSDALRGVARSKLDDHEIVVPLTGSYAPDQRRIVLTEVDGETRYDVVLDESGARGRGSVDAAGNLHIVTLDRVP